MEKALKPTPLQVIAGIILILAECLQIIAPLFDQTFADNGISWEFARFIKGTSVDALYVIGFLILMLMARETPVRVALICGIVVEFIGIAFNYYIYTRIYEAGDITLAIYTLDVSHTIISCIFWIWVFSVIIRDKRMPDIGWIQILPISLVAALSISVFFLVDSYYALPGDNTIALFPFNDNFMYKLWFLYVIPVFRMIGYYFLATCKLFNKGYSDENAITGWKAYSPFCKWLAAAIIVPAVISSLTILVYNL